MLSGKAVGYKYFIFKLTSHRLRTKYCKIGERANCRTARNATFVSQHTISFRFIEKINIALVFFCFFSINKKRMIKMNISSWSVGFCRGSRVEGKMSRVEGKMSRVESKMSRVESKMSRVEGKMSRVKWRGSRVKCRGSRVKCRGSRVKCRE